MLSTSRATRLGFPVAMIALCVFLWARIALNTAALDVPNAVGPGGWPRAMIIGLGIFSLLYLGSELLRWRSAIRMGESNVPAAVAEDEGNQTLAMVGIAIVVAYGFAIPILGFALSTVAFIAIWCVLGRVRPLTATLVSVLGTVILLYMFVAVAKMPLNRGAEPFGSWTVAIYRLLHIY